MNRTMTFHIMTVPHLVLFVAAVGVFFAQPVRAGEITLKAKTGSLEVTGALHAFDRETYLLDTETFGRLDVKASRFECVAGQCPFEVVNLAAFNRQKQDGQANDAPSIWFGGSAAGIHLIPALIQAYAGSIGARVEKKIGRNPQDVMYRLIGEDSRKVGSINIHRQGPARGFEAMRAGIADVVWSGEKRSASLDAQTKSVQTWAARQQGDAYPWATDLLVAVVAEDNPLVSISVDRLAQIFAGKIVNWSELGMPAGKIQVYAPAREMDTWLSFKDAVMAPRGFELSPDAITLSYATQWADKVANDKNGIALSSYAHIRSARALNIELPCGLINLPTSFSAKTREYALGRQLYFYTGDSTKKPLTKALLDFAKSSTFDTVLQRARFIDRAPELQPFGAAGGRFMHALKVDPKDYDQTLMEELVELLLKANRLSITYRYKPSSSELDDESRANVDRLRSLLSSEALRDKKVMLIGFSDSEGDFKDNVRLSKLHAEAVLKALVAEGANKPDAIKTFGFGELSPVACSDSAEGRLLNKRVEVWVK